MGDVEDPYTSAIYFTGPNMRPDRVTDMTKTSKGVMAKKIALRELWVAFLKQNSHSHPLQKHETEMLYKYFEENTSRTELLQAKFIF